jgi:hypothetical protein
VCQLFFHLGILLFLSYVLLSFLGNLLYELVQQNIFQRFHVYPNLGDYFVLLSFLLVALLNFLLEIMFLIKYFDCIGYIILIMSKFFNFNNKSTVLGIKIWNSLIPLSKFLDKIFYSSNIIGKSLICVYKK